MSEIATKTATKVYVFRPPKEYCTPALRRYAGGGWIPDDGKVDLAFVSGNQALYVDPPNHEGILWQWHDEKWVWHCHVRDPQQGWGRAISMRERDDHPNGKASRAAMDEACKHFGCASGHGVSPIRADDFGDIWDCDTMEKVVPPENPTCFLCMDNGRGHRLLKALEETKDAKWSMEDAQEELRKTRVRVYDLEDEVETYRESVRERAQALKVIVRELGHVPVKAILER
jgi:hypothetical protein